jgi:hypothetical protein
MGDLRAVFRLDSSSAVRVAQQDVETRMRLWRVGLVVPVPATIIGVVVPVSTASDGFEDGSPEVVERRVRTAEGVV